MARLRLRGDLLRAARVAVDLSREDVARALGLSSPARVRLWEAGLETPRPRLVPAIANLLAIHPLRLLDVNPDDPPLAALRFAAGRATTEMSAPGMSVMTYVRLEDGRSGSEPQAEVVSRLAALLQVDEPVVRSAIRRSRRDSEAAVLLQ
jgi:transcriptional regulator with XRE-family HTH domain